MSSIHPYITLAQSNVSVQPSLRRRVPTNEEFLSAAPTHQQFDTIAADITRNLPEISSESESGTSIFARAMHRMERIPALRTLVRGITCDPGVWRAIINNPVVSEIRHAHYRQASTMLLENGKTPNIFSRMWSAILDSIMPKLSALAEFFASLYGGNNSETTNAVSGAFEASDMFKTGALTALAIIIIIMVAVTLV